MKYREEHTGVRELKGLLELCAAKDIERGYVVTRSLDDIGLLPLPKGLESKIMRIPAPLLCYWMGESETHTSDVSTA